MTKFKPVDLPPKWQTYFTKYPHGFTIFEALCDWVSTLNGVIDLVNDWDDYLTNFREQFEWDMRKEVEDLLNRWLADGTLADILIMALEFAVGPRQYTEENYVTSGDTLTQSVNDLDTKVRQGFNDMYINVKNYGAKGDGSTDDTQSIQNAINAGSVWFPDGVYLVSNTIKIPSHRVVKGQSHNAILKLMSTAVAGANILENSSRTNGNTNIHVSTLMLDGNRQNRPSATGSGISIGHSCLIYSHVNKSTINNVYCKSGTIHGINITAADEVYEGIEGYKGTPSTDIVINSCFVTDCGDDGITTHWSRGVTISDCVCWDMASVFSTSSNGIEIDDGSEDINISGCVCYNTAKYNSTTNKKTYNGIETHAHDNTPAPRRVNITNCAVWNCYRGINFAHFTYDQYDISEGAFSPTAENVSVTNCTVSNCVNTGIRVTSYKSFTITGNTTDECGEHGAIRASGNARHGIIANNNIRNSETGEYAIRCWGSDSLVISNNNITDRNKRGIYPYNNTVVSGNRISSTLPAIVDGATSGIFVAEAVENVLITSNHITHFAAGVNIASTNNIESHNNMHII